MQRVQQLASLSRPNRGCLSRIRLALAYSNTIKLKVGGRKVWASGEICVRRGQVYAQLFICLSVLCKVPDSLKIETKQLTRTKYLLKYGGEADALLQGLAHGLATHDVPLHVAVFLRTPKLLFVQGCF